MNWAPAAGFAPVSQQHDGLAHTDRRGTTLAQLCLEVSVDVRDGFIIGIFNYCDRWCEACAFTSHCRLFADKAEIEASLDPGMKALVDASPLEPAPPPPPWLAELLEAMDQAVLKVTEDDEPFERALPAEHVVIEERAHGYLARVHLWLRRHALASTHDPANPGAIVIWFHTLIAAKVHRALHGLAEDDPDDRDWPPDYDGSAKVALIGIERSHAAWLQLVERGEADDADAAACITDLVWLCNSLERVFPNARAFVRPALDEPAEVSRLLRD